MPDEVIAVRGARVNNLKNISFSIPINSLSVVTGVSGSGKSSLAFDTVYAEGQRRYVESLSSYARQFLERMDKPDVDEVRGIPPAIAIRQKNSTRNPRSTVGTQTEIYDYLRLLFARAGVIICSICGTIAKKDSPESAADQIFEALNEGMKEGTKAYLLFPAAAGMPTAAIKDNRNVSKKPGKSRTQIVAHVMSLMQRGFTRFYKNGDLVILNSPDDYKEKNFDNVFALVDRLIIRQSDEMRARLVDSIETAFREGFGEAFIFTVEDKPRQIRFSESLECKCSGKSFAQPEPRLFSFNNPYGACPTCHGFGNTIGLDLGRVIPNQTLTLDEGAIEPWSKPQHGDIRASLSLFCKVEKIPMDVPFNQLTEKQRLGIIEGKGKWRGVRGFFDWLETKKYKLHIRVFLARYRGYTICPDCHGDRLRQEAREVKVGGLNLPELCHLSIKDATPFFSSLNLDVERAAIAERILYEIKRRLQFMIDVGLDYLTLDRLASTLSGGEAQRIQLATNLGSSLVGALYVLDEPSIGLHPRDSARLIRLLHNLRDIGNTVLVVEHDPEMMRAADHIIDIGPAAGEHGGEIVYQGDFNNLLKNEDSLTARYLRNDCQVKGTTNRIKPGRECLRLTRASEHNLKNIDLTLPLNMLVCITGVSGSGKSTLVHDIIYAGLKKERGEWQDAVGAFESLDGGEYIDDVVMVDQSPIGRTPRSNPVTYIKVYDVIRELFSSTSAAKAQGLNPGHFSFNVPGGRCDVCEGAGMVTVEMQFLADVELVCEECRGRRFKQNILDVLYKGCNIHDVLSMTVREALTFFKNISKLTNRLRILDDVGLGYLRLGQSATTLSGGEAQRIKLAAHLGKKAGSKMLYIFDEPTTGLHFDDINKLLAALRALIDAGGSVLVIEHNLDVVKTADYIIDLGPEGGVEGGYVVAKGTPEEIMKVDKSHTGKFLRAHLSREISLVAA